MRDYAARDESVCLWHATFNEQANLIFLQDIECADRLVMVVLPESWQLCLARNGHLFFDVLSKSAALNLVVTQIDIAERRCVAFEIEVVIILGDRFYLKWNYHLLHAVTLKICIARCIGNARSREPVRPMKYRLGTSYANFRQ
ncbi:hypothetical protein D3C85_1069220 [compost metagenome]